MVSPEWPREAGRAGRTTLWGDTAHEDPRPYELELIAVDRCQPGDVLIAAAGGSMRSGIWGELLSTAAMNAGCVAAIVDGAVRDVAKMRAMGFGVFARGTSLYDSLHRQRVIDLDLPVEVGGVVIAPATSSSPTSTASWSSRKKWRPRRCSERGTRCTRRTQPATPSAAA